MRSLTSVLGYKSVLFTALAVSFMLFFTACGGGGGDGSTTPPTPDFTASDLEGNWSMHGVSFAFTGSPLGDGTFKGGGEINALGEFIGGSFESDGLVVPLSSGSLSLMDNGEFNGTIVAAGPSGPATLNINGGKMASSKDILVFVETSTDMGSVDLGTVVKQGGTFATSDLAGTWHLFGPSVNGGAFGGATEGTIWGTFELDANGGIIGGDISTSDDMNMSAVGGALVMNSDGELTGTITASVQGQEFNVTVDSGKMDPSKNIIFMTDQTGQPINSNELIVAVKSGGTFVTSDMGGKWHLYGVSTSGALGKLTVMGSIEQDVSGKATDGSLSFRGELSGLQPVPATIIPGGTLALSGNGELSGTGDMTIQTPQGDQNSTMTIVSGKMTPSKKMSVWVLKTDDGQNGFVISIKGN